MRQLLVLLPVTRAGAGGLIKEGKAARRRTISGIQPVPSALERETPLPRRGCERAPETLSGAHGKSASPLESIAQPRALSLELRRSLGLPTRRASRERALGSMASHIAGATSEKETQRARETVILIEPASQWAQHSHVVPEKKGNNCSGIVLGKIE